jgi:hypothetical protein
MKQQIPQLSLFTKAVENTDMQTSSKQIINEEQIITPLVEVLHYATPSSYLKKESKEISETFKESLNDLFPEQQYDDKDMQKAKALLGQSAAEFTSEQLKDEIIKIQYLCETWLDDFERNIFKGLTLQELLHEKGGI